MSNKFPNWITKQMIVGVKGFNLDAFLMALEGWRRGLELTWYYNASHESDIRVIGFNPIGKTFSLQSHADGKKHFFYRSRGDKNANHAVDLVSDKDKTKLHLRESNVPSPISSRFTEENTNAEIVEHVSSIGYPLVIKPNFGSLGKGVVTNIQNESQLKSSLEYVRIELGYTDILVEQYVEGTDMRVYVIENEVLAATKRIPANVIGDGLRTIEELINEKNEQRKNNPYLATKLIEINEEVTDSLRKYDYTPKSIPKKEEIVFLKGQSNIAAGGDPVDITDEVSQEAKDIAIRAIAAIPGMHQGGVDLIVGKDRIHVIEINGTADISMHIFPQTGEPRNIPAGILDHYFPETKGFADGRTNLYFDYKKMNELMRSALLKEITISDPPQGEISAKRYVISGKVQKVGYRKWIKQQAMKRKLHGYTRNLKNGKVVVVVGGSDRNIVDEFKEVCMKGPLKSKVENVQEYIWDRQIQVGFEIR